VLFSRLLIRCSDSAVAVASVIVYGGELINDHFFSAFSDYCNGHCNYVIVDYSSAAERKYPRELSHCIHTIFVQINVMCTRLVLCLLIYYNGALHVAELVYSDRIPRYFAFKLILNCEILMAYGVMNIQFGPQ
jgi:hypothetical protein